MESTSEAHGEEAASEGVRIDFQRSGGFAGLTFGTSVDTASLPPEEARQIEDMVQQADFFALPQTVSGPPVGADRFQYDITVTRGDTSHSVSVGESAVPPTLRPLLDRLTDMARRG